MKIIKTLLLLISSLVLSSCGDSRYQQVTYQEIKSLAKSMNASLPPKKIIDHFTYEFKENASFSDYSRNILLKEELDSKKHIYHSYYFDSQIENDSNSEYKNDMYCFYDSNQGIVYLDDGIANVIYPKEQVREYQENSMIKHALLEIYGAENFDYLSHYKVYDNYFLTALTSITCEEDILPILMEAGGVLYPSDAKVMCYKDLKSNGLKITCTAKNSDIQVTTKLVYENRYLSYFVADSVSSNNDKTHVEISLIEKCSISDIPYSQK